MRLDGIKNLQATRARKAAGGTPPYLHETILSLLEDEPRGRLLDTLAFRGELSARFKEMGFEVTACDLYPEMFQVDAVVCKQADLNERFPFDDAPFDYVVLCEAIEHLENPWHVMRETARVLRPGGKVVISTPNTLSLLSRFLFFAKGVFLYFSEFEFRKPAHINPLTFNELKLVLEETDFEIRQVVGAGHQVPGFALMGLRVMQWMANVIAEMAFTLLVAYTKQSKPQTNSLLTKTLNASQGVVIVARKRDAP